VRQWAGRKTLRCSVVAWLMDTGRLYSVERNASRSYHVTLTTKTSRKIRPTMSAIKKHMVFHPPDLFMM